MDYMNTLSSSSSTTFNESSLKKKRIICVGSTLLILLIIIILCVTLIRSSPAGKNLPMCSEIPDAKKFNCYPDATGLVTERECLKRGCCYQVPRDANGDVQIPQCFYPDNYLGYSIVNVVESSDKYEAKLKKETASGFPGDVEELDVKIDFIDDATLQLKITDSNRARFEPEIPLYHKTIKERKNQLYEVKLSDIGELVIKRRASGVIIFETKLTQLVYSDQFIQLSAYVSSKYMYGLSEHLDGTLKSFNWARYTIFNQGDFPVPNRNLYGSHPFYLALEPDGRGSSSNSNGVLLLNSNAIDVILQPAPAITYRTIGGVLNFFMMFGPTPTDVIKQHTGIIGRSFMPPYWSLGFHLCKYGLFSLNKTKEIWQRNIDAEIPFDVQWNDIDYMDEFKDFTYAAEKNFSGLPEFITELHDKGMHYVAMISPGITNVEKAGTYAPYDEGKAKDLFVKRTDDSYIEGKVWNTNYTVFVDFSNPAAPEYWESQFERFHREIAFDGIWLDMNEPQTFTNGSDKGCPPSSFDDPPYVPSIIYPLCTMTICMSSKHHSTTHYNEHNLLGYRETNITYHALRKIRGKRPFIISRASFSGQGVYGGHWSGDLDSNWEHMRYTISNMIVFNFYGMPMIGSDICGFRYNTTEELCARWHTLGAFYPFSRNHNGIDTIDQDPAALKGVVEEAAKNALKTRYYLLPHLYTLFYRSHVFGETVIRPLFFEFTSDVKTYHMDQQFLWGSRLMIIPALYPDMTEVKAYFPKGIWYDFPSGKKRHSKGENFTLPAPLNGTNLAVREGTVLPLQLPEVTTTASRQNRFDLFVALTEMKEADGELYWDDGDSLDTYETGTYNLITFKATNNSFRSDVSKSGYKTSMKLNEILICGTDQSFKEVKINNEDCDFQLKEGCTSINATAFTLMEPFEITWS